MQSASPFRAWRRQLSLGISCAALLCALAAPVAAKDSDADKPPTLVQADRLSYNQDTKIVTATGHVEVSQGDQVLRADKITYDQTRDVVHAQGHVAVMQPSGDVLFADQAELTSDMKQGFVDKVSILFTDDSRLAARDARRYEGRYLIADHGLYTACSLCREHPERAPLWQIKAVRITHDNVKKDVIYRDAIIEMGGVPVLYTPYFAHPDPTVTRRQGFMSPSGGYNETLGLFARVPYYFDIAPNSDAVFMPIFSDKDRLQLGGEFRHRFTQGSMRWSGSFTRANLMDEFGVDQGQQWRGHLFGDTLFDLNNTWRAGTKVAFTSDKSYLLRYNISNDDVLTNRAFVEGFQGRHYVVGNMYYFQDLRPGNQLTEPFVAPDVRFSALGEPGKTWGGRWSMNAGLLMMSRDNTVYPAYQGPDTRRLALDGGWERQFVSSTGLLTSLSGIVRMDSYMADNVPDPDAPAGTRFSKITTLRPFAQTDMTARYPLGRRGDGYQQIVEPIAVLSVAPQSNAGQRLPNEDSLDVEFDETNLFAPNRFTGIDRLEGGTRVAYGLRHALMGDNGARIEALGGQVFRLAQNHNFPGDSGLSRLKRRTRSRVELTRFSHPFARSFFTLRSYHHVRLSERSRKRRPERAQTLGAQRHGRHFGRRYVSGDSCAGKNCFAISRHRREPGQGNRRQVQGRHRH